MYVYLLCTAAHAVAAGGFGANSTVPASRAGAGVRATAGTAVLAARGCVCVTC